MTRNNLTGSLVENLGNLTQLTLLSVGANQLEGPIPAALAGLEQLVDLNLQFNRLTGVVPSLPFKQYASYCALQTPLVGTNRFTCPVPPVSPLLRVARCSSRQEARHPRTHTPLRACATHPAAT